MHPTLTTPICTLIPLSAEHEARYMELANHPLIRDSVNNNIPYEKTHFADMLHMLAATPPRHTWMITQGDALCGAISFAGLQSSARFQGGYWVDPAYWGKGLGTAALVAVTEYLFSTTGAERVQALVEPSNAASMAVLSKAGYTREGLLRKFYPSRYRGLLDVWMYAIVR